MDKFTKTTEMDISAINEIEEKSPKKNKLGSIVSIVFCLLIAIIIWLFAMENDTTEYTRAFDDIPVNVVGSEGYEITGDYLYVDVILVGVNKDLADINKDDISVTLDIDKIKDNISNTESDYLVDVSLASGDLEERVKAKDTTVRLKINKKPWR